MATQPTQPPTPNDVNNKLDAIDSKLDQHAWLALAIMGAGWVGAGVPLALVAEPGFIGWTLVSIGFVLIIICYCQVRSIKKKRANAKSGRG
jgi:hypothetical protein